jgi:hypothetical protein
VRGGERERVGEKAGGWRKEEEMTQTLYTHMNKRYIKKKERKRNTRC